MLTETGEIKRVKATYGYYRQPDGWITVSPMADLDELHYRKRGWEPLSQYGRIELTTEYAADHPLEALFIQGGAHELSVDQIIKSALHLTRPLIPVCRQPLNQFHPTHKATCWQGAQPVEFPQLQGVIPDPVACRFCDRSQFPTEEARDQHETVSHKEEKGDIRTGQTLADALIKGLNGGQSRPAPVAAVEQSVLSVLSEVGLNKTQLAALKAAGLIQKEPSNDEPD